MRFRLAHLQLSFAHSKVVSRSCIFRLRISKKNGNKLGKRCHQLGNKFVLSMSVFTLTLAYYKFKGQGQRLTLLVHDTVRISLKIIASIIYSVFAIDWHQASGLLRLADYPRIARPMP